MKPEYRSRYAASGPDGNLFLNLLMEHIPWLQETEARKEYSEKPVPSENFVHGKWLNPNSGSYNGTSTRIDMARLDWRKCIRERKS